MPYWITRCQVQRFSFAGGRYVDTRFTSITKVRGPFNTWEEAKAEWSANWESLSEKQSLNPTWTRYTIHNDEGIANDMRLLKEALDHGARPL